jgi:hypothetical protein
MLLFGLSFVHGDKPFCLAADTETVEVLNK